MNSKEYLLTLIFGSLLLTAQPAPTPDGQGPAAVIMACLGRGCDMESGPVCGIDDSGLPMTFENRCMADMAYCRDGTFYAEVKPGEC